MRSALHTTLKLSNSYTLLATKRAIPSIINRPPLPLIRFHQIPKFQIQARAMASATSFYDFKPLDKKGAEVSLDSYKGKVVLIVNTASKCGFTPQYDGLEMVYKKLKAEHGDDFQILGFPCNQFGAQESGTDDEIQTFCQVNYGVSFPIMGKTEVNGSNASPLFEWLKSEQPGLLGMKRVKWNFEKWLIGRDGNVKGRWASTTKPESLEKPILEELAKSANAKI
ncbi:glutathione peroxidase-like protein [Calycina marina]|uniref:Glutathione peroxidase n=1 Tax=Calycina marina TaxID=1763456 RepID=A0A9P7YX71_9HELO|nr:glutathione peroxidase-like protein [Calycina marina]